MNSFICAANVAAYIGNLLRHKKDWMYLRFYCCRGVFPTAHIAPSLRGLTQLQKLVLWRCDIDDESSRLILESISDSHGLEHLDLSRNKMTPVTLRTLTAHIPVALRKLKTLNLKDNVALLNNKLTTQHFVDSILLSDDMDLSELNISQCGKCARTIIEACEDDKNKLQVLSMFYLDRHDFAIYW